MTREAETVEKIARAIEAAELEWKAANGDDDASCLDCPGNVKATSALSVIREIVFEEVGKKGVRSCAVCYGTGHRRHSESACEICAGTGKMECDRTAAEIKAALIERLGSG